MKRIAGFECVSVSAKKKKIPARNMSSPCKNYKFECPTKFKVEERAAIFTDYWQLENLQRQRDYLIQNMELLLLNMNMFEFESTVHCILEEPITTLFTY